MGQYIIEAQIGTGGMATVYKAHHAKLDRYVAVKIMHPAFLEDPTFQARFQREARIIANLDHPHIVPVYDFDDHGKQPYLIMKFIEGQTLKQVIRSDDGISSQQALIIMQKIGDALTYAHQKGILHRDVKPSNIIIDANGEPYLMDFGLARIAQAGESTMSTDMMLGTPQYISPEQAQGKTDLTSATDIYSFGIVLYELIVGRVPFVGESTYAIVHDHIYSPLPLPSDINPDISPEIEAILLKALSKNPDERYETPNALIEDYAHALSGTNKGTIAQHAKISPQENVPNIVAPPTPVPPPPSAIPSPINAGSRRDQRKERRLERRNERHIEKKIEQGISQWLEETFSGKKKDITPQFDNPNSDEAIRARVEKRLKARSEVMMHFISFLLGNAMVWVIYLLTSPGGHPWPLYVTMGWGIGIFAHMMGYYNEHGRGRERHEEQMQREIERERQRLASSATAKIKNDDITYADAEIRLTGDGELTDSFIDEVENQNQNLQR